MTPVRVLLADDHPLLRAGVRAQLERIPGVSIVGEAGDAEDALSQAAAARPDVVVMDISMPGMPGLEALRTITSRFPPTRVVMLTLHDEEEYVLGAMRAGAAGYVLKVAKPAELPLALEAVMAGHTFISPAVARTVAQYLQKSGPDAPHAVLLTPRQQEVLRLIAGSRNTKEIATLLKVSVKTVEMHRARLMERLGIYDVAGLVRHAIRSGIVRPDS
jgi:DNA-binding NarL/FixJ family response regulator